MAAFEDNIQNWSDFIAWCRWYPDLWWDLISDEGAPIKLDLDQRVFLRCLARFISTYGVFPRGYGKTMLEVMGMYHASIFFPEILLAMTAQTKENAAKILKEKHDELVRSFPLLAHEVEKLISSKDEFVCYFKSGGRIDVLANQQSTKGSRRRRLNVEESALLDNKLFEDVLEPVVNVQRRTLGTGLIDPEELNGQINFFTTSGYRGSSEFERSQTMVKEMIALKGKMVIGSSWELACEYGRGEKRHQLEEKKERLSPTFFAQNYESKWVGSTDGAIIPIRKLIELRTLKKAEFKSDGKSDYVLAMDVARSGRTDRNQSSIAVLKLRRSKDGRIIRIQLVNLINLENGLTFEQQTIILKKFKNLFEPIMVVVDGNGLGRGIIDEAVAEQIDPDSGEILGAWKPVNTEQEAESEEYEEILYDLKATGINHDIILSFQNAVESGKLEILEKEQTGGYDVNDFDFFEETILPNVQTSLFIDEVANLKVKIGQNGRQQVEQATKRIDKDRYSAIAYGLWWIKSIDDYQGSRQEEKATDYFFAN